MNKQTYLAKLAQLLAPLPEQERQDALNYYEEYFDAAGPEAEDATAAELGDPADAARKILEGEGLMLDSAQAAAGESSDAADTAQDAAPQPTGENPSTTKPKLHGPAAIPPVMGVLLALAAVLVVVCVLLIGFFGVRRSSIANTAETFVVSAAESVVEQPQDASSTTATPDSEIVEENGTAAEGPSGAVDDNSPHTTDMSCDNITLQDAVLDIDYGRLTIVIDPGATSAALHCENVYNKRLDVTYTENEPLTIRYKVPANCDLSSEPEPEFVLSVPDAETFHFKSSPSLPPWATWSLTTAIPSPPTASIWTWQWATSPAAPCRQSGLQRTSRWAILTWDCWRACRLPWSKPRWAILA